MKVSFKALLLGLLVLGFVAVIGQAAGISRRAAAPPTQGEVIQEGTIHLQGFTRFGFFAKKENRVLADPYTNCLPCTAELTLENGQNFLLIVKEYFDPAYTILYREGHISGKMTPSGELKYSWPDTFLELDENYQLVEKYDVLATIRMHTGCVLMGPGINKSTLNYNGYFDGTKLFADTHLVGLQEVPGTMPFLVEMVDGPIMINFMLDVEVVD